MIVVIGSGIVGAATARELAHRGHRVVVLDKEAGPAHHQSGRNSGVVHSGIYYRHGTEKQRLTADGRTELLDYVRERRLPVSDVPKLIVATEKDELAPLRELEVRAQDNGIPTERLGRQGLGDAEPGVVGRSALVIRTTAITDFAAVTAAFLDDVRSAGGDVRFGTMVEHIEPGRCVTGSDTVEATTIVNCAGADTIRLAVGAGVTTDVEIVGFRGAYWRSPRRLSHMVYPVPDPRFPFLGAHLTPTLAGDTLVGPTAMVSPTSEVRDGGSLTELVGGVRSLAESRAVRALVRSNWRSGLGELARSMSTELLTLRVQRMFPELDRRELEPAPAGVRAQALRGDGTLLDDFVFAESPGAVHVLNAPSPAATASMAIARRIADRVDACERHRPASGSRA